MFLINQNPIAVSSAKPFPWRCSKTLMFYSKRPFSLITLYFLLIKWKSLRIWNFSIVVLQKPMCVSGWKQALLIESFLDHLQICRKWTISSGSTIKTWWISVLSENVRENNNPSCKKEKNRAFLLSVMSRLAKIYGHLKVLNWRDPHRLLSLRKADLDLNKHKVEQPWGDCACSSCCAHGTLIAHSNKTFTTICPKYNQAFFKDVTNLSL